MTRSTGKVGVPFTKSGKAAPAEVLAIVCAGVMLASLVYAALLVFFGRLADGYRRDRAFLLGVAVFTAASAACSASTSVGMLVGFRLVQAAGAALLTPTSLGLVLASDEPERRHGAVRAWTAVGGMAAAVGPVVGGLLVAASWRWVFLVNVPIGIPVPVPSHTLQRTT